MNTTKTHINRRSFFKSTVIAGGGLVLGFNWLTSCKSDKEIDPSLPMPEEWFDINAYLKIGENGKVTIISPNPEIGQNVKTSMPMIVAEELDVPWHHVHVEQGKLDTDVFDRQVAGGSQSIRKGWDGLRKAGATAKAMLITAAANEWGVSPKDCKASDGIIKGPNGEELGYGAVASAAGKLEVPEEVTLKEPKDYKIIGKSKKNVDLDKILQGEALYGIDTKIEGMKYAVVMRPPAFGQKLISYDDSKAKAVNGVEQVLKFGNKIAVIAKNTWAAMKGKKALVAEWAIDTTLESTAMHDEKLTDILGQKEFEPMRKDGDVTKAFAETDQVVERIYESPFLPHSCMEPMNFFADVKDGKASLLGPIQTPAWTRGRAAAILGIEEKDVSVDMTRMGGGFGRRLYGDFSDEAAEISSLAKCPIQLVFSREDDMTAGTYRVALKYKIEASIKDNKITGYRLTEAASNSNMYGLIPNFFPAGAIPNLEIRGGKMDSNITTGAWRAPYTNFLGFAEQSFFDELAEITGQDPIQFRLDLLEDAKVAAANDEKIEYSPERMQGVIRLVAEKAGYTPESNKKYGVSAYYSHNTHVAEIAEVEMKDDQAVVRKVYCAVDCGLVINRDAAKNQVEGGIIDGIGHAMYGDLTFENGQPSISNFHNYRLIRNMEAPEIEVFFVENELSPTGLGEPSLPPAGGAVANAIYRLTGKRLYKQPFDKELRKEILG